jgi:hypothetical protein
VSTMLADIIHGSLFLSLTVQLQRFVDIYIVKYL